MENYKYIHISQIMSHGALWSVVSTNQCYLISWPCHDIYTSRKKWKKLGDIRSCVHFAVFLFQDDEDFLLLFVLFLSDSTFAEIYTLSSPTYHICSALQFLLRFFLPFSIHYFIQYLEGNSDFWNVIHTVKFQMTLNWRPWEDFSEESMKIVIILAPLRGHPFST